MMSWSPTERRNAVSGATRLLSRTDWRESTHEPELRRIVESASNAEDPVLRLRAAYAIRILEPDPQATLARVRLQLLTEPVIEIASVLIGQLSDLTASFSAELDALVEELLATDLWTGRLASDDHDTVESLAALIGLMLRLAITKETPAAQGAILELFTNPVGRTISHRALTLLRGWLALPPSRDLERQRAFSIARSAAKAIEELRTTLDEEEDIVDLYRSANAIATQLYFASGAFKTSDDGQVSSTPPQSGFAHEAFSVLDYLTSFKEPSIVHHLVETIRHLASENPSRAFRIMDRAVSTGDAYTFDQIAADAAVGLVERYLADFRDHLADDAELLSAVRRVLSAFTHAGWPSAISLAYRLSDAFR